MILVTPEDYEPPGFKAGDMDTFLFQDETMKIRIGDVSSVIYILCFASDFLFCL